MGPTSADAADLRFDGLVLFRVLPFLSWRGSAEEIGGRAGLGAAGVLAGAFLRRPIQSDVLLTDLAIVQGRIEHTVLLSCGVVVCCAGLRTTHLRKIKHRQPDRAGCRAQARRPRLVTCERLLHDAARG